MTAARIDEIFFGKDCILASGYLVLQWVLIGFVLRLF